MDDTNGSDDGLVIVVTGSRTIESQESVTNAIEETHWSERVDEIWHGGADGADRYAENWASQQDLEVRSFPAENYDSPEKRNAEMLRTADEYEKQAVIVAVPNEDSSGTWDTVEKAKDRNLDVHVHREGVDDKQKSLF